MKLLSSYLKRYKLLVLSSTILTIISVWAMLYQPSLISEVINGLSETDSNGQVSPNTDKINSAGQLMILVGFLGLIASVLNTFIAARISQTIGAAIRYDGISKIQTFSYQDVEKFTTSNLVVRLTNDVTQIQNFTMQAIQIVLRVPVLFVGAFILALITLPDLWWVIVLFIILVGVLLVITMKYLQPQFSQLQNNIDNVNSVVKENLIGVRVVKSFVGEQVEEKRFFPAVDKLTENLFKIGRGFSILVPGFLFLANIATAYAIFYIGGSAIDKPEVIGDVVAFISYMLQLMMAIIMIGFISMIFGRAIVSMKRINEIMEFSPSVNYGEIDNISDGEIEFRDVSFSFSSDDDYTLKNISFKVSKNEHIGIIGGTGSGKSTLINLIPNLFSPTKGEIFIDNINIDEYSERAFYENISLIHQKPIINSGKIIDTIKSGKQSASMDEVIRAAKQAQAYEFIEKKENGFDSEVLEKGNNFSGGQKQRLALARGLIKNPKILILDDSTSALDSKSEKLVKEALNNDFQDTTLIMVAQKISSIINMDRIIVLSNGEIEAIDTHENLISKSATYRKILESQLGKEETNA